MGKDGVMTTETITGLSCHAETRLPEALALAETLGVSLLQTPEPPCLVLEAERLVLLPGQGMGPVWADFLGGAVGHRHRFGGGRGQTIARAVGLKAGASPSVIDATAGLGRDAFVLASLGCSVRMIERSPVVAALLNEGLVQAARDSGLAAWVSDRLQLHQGDAAVLLSQLCTAQSADVVYLDPMYPHRKKSALVKKEMRVFRQILGDDLDADALLSVARSCARKRVVVKRPKGAEPLAGVKPGLELAGKSTRYDVYLI